MTVMVEQRLRFDFGQTWQVEKYDEHLAYRDGIERLKEQIPCKDCLKLRDVGTKAVDFVGRRKGQADQLYLIEVKDFRGHAVENRKRMREDLATEVAIKVRDTLAGLVGALHVRRKASLRHLAEPVSRQPPKLLLWLEVDPVTVRIEQRGDPTLDLRNALKQRLDWLGSDVMIVNQEKLWPALDLQVRRLPDRVYEVRRKVKEDGGISRDEFCRAWGATLQTAGGALVKLCASQFLERAPGDGDRFTAGPRWVEFHEEPS